jgi:hypothetical protein
LPGARSHRCSSEAVAREAQNTHNSVQVAQPRTTWQH